MKTKFFTLLLALVVCAGTLNASVFKYGDLYYYITSNVEPYTVAVIPEYYPWEGGNYSGLTTATIPASITYNDTTYSVTSIEDFAFVGCYLTSVTIPNSVTSIGYAAFYGCEDISSVTIPNSVTNIGDSAFYDCVSLASITIGNSVTNIGGMAFGGCEGITKTNYTGDIAGWCNIDFEGGGTSNPIFYSHNLYINNAEVEDLVIPDGVTTIKDYAFSNCTGLTSVTIPNSVTSIGYRAFYACRGLTSITIGNSVTSIGRNAFVVCNDLTKTNYTGDIAGWCNIDFEDDASNPVSYSRNLYINDVEVKDLVIPNGVTTIKDYAFLDCTGLTSVTIPNSVTSIGYRAFYACRGLTSITIPNSVTNIENSAFYCVNNIVYNGKATGSPWGAKSVNGYVEGYLVYENATKTQLLGCSSVATGEIVIPESVTSIGDQAFYGCTGITSITVSNNVTSIGKRAFYGCSGLIAVFWNAKNCAVPSESSDAPFRSFPSHSQLTSFTFGNKVESIPDYLCYDLENLTSVTIPNSVTSIGEGAFMDCSGLTSVTCEAIIPPTCGEHAFSWKHKKIPVNIPCSTIDAYRKAETWKDFTNLQEPPMLSISVQTANAKMGQVLLQSHTRNVYCETTAIISATANVGYHFVRWSDGNTENPRTIVLTQDTILTAEFGQSYSGKCGDNLYWQYKEGELKITGSGTMYDYTEITQPWLLLRDSIRTIYTDNTVSSIGKNAFAKTSKLSKLYIGGGMEQISANAFAGCQRLYDIYCYPTYPAFAEESSFANYNVYLHVPCESLRDYQLDVVWGNFKFIECIGSDEVALPSDEVVVIPSDDDAIFQWPSNPNANAYSLVISKDGVVFCTLTFNSNGQLTGIAFAPARDRNNTHATYAAQATVNGWQFTVTGLSEGSSYTYALTVCDRSNKVLQSYEGTFTTLSNIPSALNGAVSGEESIRKIVHDGQVLIQRGNKVYTLTGEIVNN